MRHRRRGEEPGGDRKGKGSGLGGHDSGGAHGPVPGTGPGPEGRHEAGGKGPGDQQKGCIPGPGGKKAIRSREQKFSGFLLGTGSVQLRSPHWPGSLLKIFL